MTSIRPIIGRGIDLEGDSKLHAGIKDIKIIGSLTIMTENTHTEDQYVLILLGIPA